MGILSTFKNIRARLAYTGAPDFWSTVGGGSTSLPNVTPESALTIATAYACIRAISSTIAMIPKGIYQVTDGGKEIDPNHPAHRLIAEQPNPFQTPFDFWDRMQTASLTYGRAIAVINRDKFTGQPISLTQVVSSRIRLLTVDGIPVVEVEGTPYNWDDVLMIQETGGRSPIELHAQTLGMTKQVEKYGADFFKGGHMLGVLSSDSSLTNDQLRDLQRAWQTTEKNGVKILPVGMKYTPISLPPEQTQFLTTRKYQDEVICTIFGVPPRVVGVNTQDTKTNGEEQARNFAQRTILPRTEAIRQEIERKLLPSFERSQYTAHFDLREMTKGDTKARAEYFSMMLDRGVMSRNEVRSMEGMNKVSDQGSDSLILQSNQITLDKIDEFSTKISAT